MEETKHFTLGFCTTGDGKVCLVLKTIESYGGAGWNGVGGRVEAGETVAQCMAREWLEETGLPPVDWEKCGELLTGGCVVHCFSAHVPHSIVDAPNAGSETWGFIHIKQALSNFHSERRGRGGRMCDLAPALLALCEDPAARGRKGQPRFRLSV